MRIRDPCDCCDSQDAERHSAAFYDSANRSIAVSRQFAAVSTLNMKFAFLRAESTRIAEMLDVAILLSGIEFAKSMAVIPFDPVPSRWDIYSES